MLRFIYYSLLYTNYKLIKFGRGGNQWSATSACVSIPVFFIISLHITIAKLIGIEPFIKYNLKLYGSIFIIIFCFLNIALFVRNQKYLLIENEFDSDIRKKRISYFIFGTYFTWIIFTLYLAF